MPPNILETPIFPRKGDDSVPSPCFNAFQDVRLSFAGAVRTFGQFARFFSPNIASIPVNCIIGQVFWLVDDTFGDRTATRKRPAGAWV